MGKGVKQTQASQVSQATSVTPVTEIVAKTPRKKAVVPPPQEIEKVVEPTNEVVPTIKSE